MKTLAFLAAIVTAACASAASACDISPFPNRPADLPADVIVLGRIDRLTETRDPVSGRVRASAEVTVERVAAGVFADKVFRLDYPIVSRADPCDYAEGPVLHGGDGVALYFRNVSGKLTLMDWFRDYDAQFGDPRVAPRDGDAPSRQSPSP